MTSVSTPPAHADRHAIRFDYMSQEQLLRAQQETINRLEQRLQSLSPQGINLPGEEPPPPHY